MLEAGAAEDDEDAHTRMKCWGWGAFGALGNCQFFNFNIL